MDCSISVLPLLDDTHLEDFSIEFVCTKKHVLWSPLVTSAFQLPVEEDFMNFMIWHSKVQDIAIFVTSQLRQCPIGMYDYQCSVTDLNLKVDTHKSQIIHNCHKHFPTKTMVVSNSIKPWMIQEIRETSNTPSQLHSSSQLNVAKLLRNHVVKSNSKTKKHYIHEKV